MGDGKRTQSSVATGKLLWQTLFQLTALGTRIHSQHLPLGQRLIEVEQDIRDYHPGRQSPRI